MTKCVKIVFQMHPDVFSIIFNNSQRFSILFNHVQSFSIIFLHVQSSYVLTCRYMSLRVVALWPWRRPRRGGHGGDYLNEHDSSVRRKTPHMSTDSRVRPPRHRPATRGTRVASRCRVLLVRSGSSSSSSSSSGSSSSSSSSSSTVMYRKVLPKKNVLTRQNTENTQK